MAQRTEPTAAQALSRANSTPSTGGIGNKNEGAKLMNSRSTQRMVNDDLALVAPLSGPSYGATA